MMSGGLAELLKAEQPAERIEIYKIKPSTVQPRRGVYPIDRYERLRESIRKNGILEPILVRPALEGYELVIGSTRLRAATELGHSQVLAIVKTLTDAQALELALIENFDREDLNPLDETEGLLQLLAMQLHRSTDEVALLLYRMSHHQSNGSVDVIPEAKQVQQFFELNGRMGWQSFTKNRLRLLKLPEDILNILRSGKLEYTKAIEIAKIKDDEMRSRLIVDAIAQKWTLDQVKAAVAEAKPVRSRVLHPVQHDLEIVYTGIKAQELWKDPKKSKKIADLLKKIKQIMESEP